MPLAWVGGGYKDHLVLVHEGCCDGVLDELSTGSQLMCPTGVVSQVLKIGQVSGGSWMWDRWRRDGYIDCDVFQSVFVGCRVELDADIGRPYVGRVCR